MNKRALHKAGWQMDSANGVDDGVEQYCADHPRSPSAVRRPKVFTEGNTFIVLLGRDLEHGIVGLGNTVENALRAFDSRYLNVLRPPEARRLVRRARACDGP